MEVVTASARASIQGTRCLAVVLLFTGGPELSPYTEVLSVLFYLCTSLVLLCARLLAESELAC